MKSLPPTPAGCVQREQEPDGCHSCGAHPRRTQPAGVGKQVAA
jgi:hypothetical protein